MSLLLLDTTVLIDAERGVAALDDVIADDDDTAIAAITVAELQSALCALMVPDATRGRRSSTRWSPWSRSFRMTCLWRWRMLGCWSRRGRRAGPAARTT